MTRLLLDAMYPATLADQLCQRGHDVLAVACDPVLRVLADEALLAVAAEQGRCLLTENVRDFEQVRTLWASHNRQHAGLLYASARRFPRDRKRVSALVEALDARLTGGRLPASGVVDWLT